MDRMRRSRSRTEADDGAQPAATPAPEPEAVESQEDVAAEAETEEAATTADAHSTDEDEPVAAGTDCGDSVPPAGPPPVPAGDWVRKFDDEGAARHRTALTSPLPPPPCPRHAPRQPRSRLSRLKASTVQLGDAYFYNTVSQRSQWDEPEGWHGSTLSTAPSPRETKSSRAREDVRPRPHTPPWVMPTCHVAVPIALCCSLTNRCLRSQRRRAGSRQRSPKPGEKQPSPSGARGPSAYTDLLDSFSPNGDRPPSPPGAAGTESTGSEAGGGGALDAQDEDGGDALAMVVRLRREVLSPPPLLGLPRCLFHSLPTAFSTAFTLGLPRSFTACRCRTRSAGRSQLRLTGQGTARPQRMARSRRPRRWQRRTRARWRRRRRRAWCR